MLKFDQESKTVALGENLSFQKSTNELTGEESIHMRICSGMRYHHLLIPPVVYSQFLQYMEELKQ